VRYAAVVLVLVCVILKFLGSSGDDLEFQLTSGQAIIVDGKAVRGTPDELRALNDAQLQMMLEQGIAALQSLNMTFFLCFGTALGAVRHGDIIDGDYDIDFGIMAHEFGKLGPTLDIRKRRLYAAFAAAGPFNAYNFPKRVKLFHPPDNATRNARIPNMFAFVHDETKRNVDVYLFYNKDGVLWDFSDFYKGRTGPEPLAKRFPLFNPCPVRFRGFDLLTAPVAFLARQYGNSFHKPVRATGKFWDAGTEKLHGVTSFDVVASPCCDGRGTPEEAPGYCDASIRAVRDDYAAYMQRSRGRKLREPAGTYAR
jgi:hypothetical protein